MNCLSMPIVTGFIKGSPGELDTNRQLTVDEMAVLQPLQTKQDYCIVYHLTAYKDKEQHENSTSGHV